ncbi:DnaD domain protein [Holzapfeliella floricola]|uniref:Helicase loader dnab n=1 Tax=Holzapfeliella floricola DSM 23037 = JCM 16512 TaxID=1423744 RepID=A0A0R2DIM2_9LACO|nr:DnaD domain protein [Holzapfeliella floricola]KRN03902.1 helicase loader dnab [Holzapfeliella floricola DSM 23037 = JCM 16512]
MTLFNNPRQQFYTLFPQQLTAHEIEVLTLLYQPLIGAKSVSLFLTLNQLADKMPTRSQYKTLIQIQEQTDLSLNEIDQARQKLEGVSLLKTYQDSNEVLGLFFVFEVKPVLSVSEFFQTFLLSSLLLEKIGEVRYRKLKEKYVQPKPVVFNQPKDISSSFFDIFHVREEQVLSPSPAVQEMASQTKKYSQNDDSQLDKKQFATIEWGFLTDFLAAYHIPEREIMKHQKRFYDMMRFYEISEQDLGNIIVKTLNVGDATLNFKRIENMLADTYHSTAHVAKQNLQTKSKKPQDQESFSIEEKKLVASAKKITPLQYLERYKNQKGGFSTFSEKQILYRLSQNVHLSDEIINMMIWIALRYEPTLKQNLMDNLANDWLQQGITSAEQVVEYLKTRENKSPKTHKKTKYQPKTTHKEIATDWSKKENQSQIPEKKELSNLDSLLEEIDYPD